MKKVVVFLFFIAGFYASAQEIGLRIGSFEKSNIAISGIVNFEDNTRLHGDVTFGQGIGAHLLYDFKVKPINTSKPNIQYYLGAGLGCFIGNPFTLGVNGEAGLECLFKKTPLTVGLDWRPQVDVVSKTSLQILQFGFNVRYRINEL